MRLLTANPWQYIHQFACNQTRGFMTQPFGRKAFLHTLPAGEQILLGPVIPEDRNRIVDGVERMSGYTRYLRFFTGTPHLTDELIAYLTQVDQSDHVAWAAVEPVRPELPGIGLGRFVRLKNDPATAEFALAVVDKWQHRGVGEVLLAILHLLAARRGIRTLRGLVLPENEIVFTWFCNLGARVQYGTEVHQMDLTVDQPPATTTTCRRFRELMHNLRGRLDELESA